MNPSRCADSIEDASMACHSRSSAITRFTGTSGSVAKARTVSIRVCAAAQPSRRATAASRRRFATRCTRRSWLRNSRSACFSAASVTSASTAASLTSSTGEVCATRSNAASSPCASRRRAAPRNGPLRLAGPSRPPGHGFRGAPGLRGGTGGGRYRRSARGAALLEQPTQHGVVLRQAKMGSARSTGSSGMRSTKKPADRAGGEAGAETPARRASSRQDRSKQVSFRRRRRTMARRPSPSGPGCASTEAAPAAGACHI